MFALRSVQAGIRKPQTFHGLASDDVRFDDLIDIRLGNVSVPDSLRVDDEIRAMLALIETSGLIGTYLAFKAALG